MKQTMKLVPSNQADDDSALSHTMRFFFYGVGLMVFSVFLSVIDQPSTTASHQVKADLVDPRRNTQVTGGMGERGLIKGKGTVRIAAFGSANTWGAGLENRYKAYPYLLSDEVDNFAMFAGGPNYPSVCTQTIVGDDGLYDVILLEYWLKAHQGLSELARRLRQRFPNALILFIKVWAPIHARRLPSEHADHSEEESFEQWRNSQFPPDAQINDIAKALKGDTGYWFFPESPHADLLMGEIRKAVGGFNVRIAKKDTAKETLEFYLHFFNHQNSQLSPLGHEFLANMTKATLDVKLMTSTPEDLVNSGIHGHWGRGDDCHVWYTTGGYSPEYSPSLQMKEFDSMLGKFGLEVTGPGWFNVENKFHDERTLYLSFLAETVGYYPVATINVGNGPPVTLIPNNDGDPRHSHIARTIPVGKIPPGTTTIQISTSQGAKYPFRLVGVSITNELAVPLEYGFGPQFNR